MSLRLYTLVGQTPVATEDVSEAARAFMGERRVAVTEVGPYLVSTVFLGVDHNWGSKGKPLLFETMVFKGVESLGCRRCSTWLEAEAQHREVVNDTCNMAPDSLPMAMYPEELIVT